MIAAVFEHGLDIHQLTPNATLGDLFRHSFCIGEATSGSFVAETFEQQPYLPGVLILRDDHGVSLISRRAFLEQLSQPYGLEIFLKRPIHVFLSIARVNEPLILPATTHVTHAVEQALQRPSVQLYEPIVVQDIDNHWSLVDFQVLLLAQTRILSLQKEELAQKSQQIVALNDRLTWQANHDPLTQLLNRRAFKRYVQEAISDAQVSHNQHILCYIDLDRFKVVNDTCGHAAGDELLRQVSHLLQSGLRKSDTVSRLGGDEFALLLRCCELDDGIRIANTLRKEVEDLRFTWKGKVFRIGASIGLVSIDLTSHDLNQVMGAADSACYVAKNRGRNRVYVYEPDNHELLLQQTATQSVTELQRALEENRLILYCQPLLQLGRSNQQAEFAARVSRSQFQDNLQSDLKLDLQPDPLPGDRVVGYEILLRFQDIDGEILLPNPFIVAAERYKLMHLIDRWVIKHLFAFYQTVYQTQTSQDWPPDHPFPEPNLLYMVNLSGESIKDPDFLAFVRTQIEAYQIPAHVICFEITETVATTNLQQTEHCIRELRVLGCKFALDDFGSGMSCFTYLKQLKVDFLKIDSGLVRDVASDSLNSGIVKAIHEVGHQIGLKTIAEGVETLEVLETLRNLGIDYVQGYCPGLPQPLEVGVIGEAIGQLQPIVG